MPKVQSIAASEVAKHNEVGDTWVSLHGKVYNVSDFVNQHPAGPAAIQARGGKDITEIFERVNHSLYARDRVLSKLYIGELVNDLIDDLEGGNAQDEPTEASKTKERKSANKDDDDDDDDEEDNKENSDSDLSDDDNDPANKGIDVKDKREPNTIAVDWHVLRRHKILEAHPEILDLCEGNPWSIAVGIAVSMIHLAGMFLVQYMPNFFYVFLFAYTVGATCKMYQFVIGHDLIHKSCGEWAAIPLVQKWLMILVNLPCFGNFLHYYVSLLHIGHHASLGRHGNFKDVDQDGGAEIIKYYNKKKVVPGSIKLDGDLVSPNYLREYLSIRLPDGNIFIRIIKHCLSPIIFSSVFWFMELTMFVHLWGAVPSLACYYIFGYDTSTWQFWAVFLVVVPSGLNYFYSLSYCNWPVILTVSWIAITYWVVGGVNNFLAGTVNGVTAWHSLAYMILSDLFFHGFCLHPYGGYFMTVHNSTKSRARDELEGNEMTSLTSSASSSSSSSSSTVQAGQKYTPLRTDAQLYAIDGEDDYVDSDDDHNNLNTDTEDDDMNTKTDDVVDEKNAGEHVFDEEWDNVTQGCQPTQSVYSKYSGWLTGNLTYHVEHHDFPMVPWNRLPQIKAMAPEFYDNLTCSPSLFHNVWRYIWHGDPTEYSCFD